MTSSLLLQPVFEEANALRLFITKEFQSLHHSLQLPSELVLAPAAGRLEDRSHLWIPCRNSPILAWSVAVPLGCYTQRNSRIHSSLVLKIPTPRGRRNVVHQGSTPWDIIIQGAGLAFLNFLLVGSFFFNRGTGAVLGSVGKVYDSSSIVRQPWCS